MNKQEQHLDLINFSERFVSFSKECIAETLPQLEKKLYGLSQGSFNRLAQLNIIPKKLTINEDKNFYQISHEKLATKVKVLLQYYELLGNPIEEQFENHDRIRNEHQIRYLSSTRIHTLKGQLHRVEPINKRTSHNLVVVKGESQEELIMNLKNSIWGLLQGDITEGIRIIGFEIDHLKCMKIDNYYQAEYRYILSKDKLLDFQNRDEEYKGEEL